MNMIRFESSAGAAVTMDADLALAFIRMSGHHDMVPGAIVADDLPEALARLRHAVAEAARDPDAVALPDTGDQDEDEPPVKLPTRAFPLVRLLEAAERAHKDVLWDRFDGVYI